MNQARDAFAGMTSANRLVSVLIAATVGISVERPNAPIRLDIRREGDAAFIVRTSDNRTRTCFPGHNRGRDFLAFAPPSISVWRRSAIASFRQSIAHDFEVRGFSGVWPIHHSLSLLRSVYFTKCLRRSRPRRSSVQNDLIRKASPLTKTTSGLRLRNLVDNPRVARGFCFARKK